MALSDYDGIVKVVLIGESGVGKSSMVHRILTGECLGHSSPTIGIDFHVKDVMCNGRKFKLQLWDTGGQERFYSLTNTYYRDMNGAFLVFDLNSQSSFERLKSKWYPDLITFLGDHKCSMVMIGNKNDLEERVNLTEVEEFATSHEIKFIKTSALNSENLEQALHMMVQLLVTRVFPVLPHGGGAGEGGTHPNTIRLGAKDSSEEQNSPNPELENGGICCSS